VSVQQLVQVFADVGVDAFAPLLEAELARRGYQLVERLDHAAGAVYPALGRHVDGHDDLEAFTVHEPAAVGIAPPTTVVHQRIGAVAGRRWDPALTRALSRATGGFALALEAARTRDEYGLGAYYDGRVLSEDRPTVADEDDVWAALVARHAVVTGGHEAQLRWGPADTPRSWIVRRGPVPPAAAPPLLRRAFFANVSGARVHAAIGALGSLAPASLRVCERMTPTAEIPYVLVDGDFVHGWFSLLAQELQAFAVAVNLPASGTRFTWASVDPDGRSDAGDDAGLEAFARVLGVLTVTMGEPPAILRWPAEAGGA
jgi:hypothetical protein